MKISCTFRHPTGIEPIGFEQGDICISGAFGEANSSRPGIDQSMMLLISLSELLDGISGILASTRRQFEFIGADSSFSVVFSRVNSDELAILVDGIPIHAAKPSEIFEDIKKCMDEFVQSYDLPRLSNKSELDDFHNSLSSFRKIRLS